MDHSHFWETEVCPYLANLWAAKVSGRRAKVASASLRAAFVGHYTAFPRGRVARGEKGMAVYWGENFPRGTRHLKASIGRYFGLPRKVAWVRDDHERCLGDDYHAVRALLPLDTRWSSVD